MKQFENVESITVMLEDRTLISQVFVNEDGDLVTLEQDGYITEIVIKDPSTDESSII